MERSSLYVFYFCLQFCAVLALAGIWTNGAGGPVWLFKLIPTTFIIGLSAFLTWFTYLMSRLALR